MTAVHTIPFEDIEVGARMRQLRETTVVALMESIRDVGLLHPISVRRTGKKFHLIAGAHRLEAAKRLKIFAGIDAILVEKNSDQVMLAEIDENLIRAELTPAETAMHIAKRKEVYERLHPETKAGGDRKSKKAKSKSQNENLKTFVKDTAKKTGKGRSTVAKAATRGKKLKDVLPEVVGTSLDQGDQLDALAKLPEDKRDDLVARAKAGENVNAKTAGPKPTPPITATTDDREGARQYAEQLQARRATVGAQKPEATQEEDEDESDLVADLDALETKDLLRVSACCVKHVTRVIGKCTDELPHEEHPKLLNFVKGAVDYMIKEEVEQSAKEAET